MFDGKSTGEELVKVAGVVILCGVFVAGFLGAGITYCIIGGGS